ncbi:MAG: ABC transporter ATP-binding protein [Treponema sp.]|nr:ABC transporter ATP-binding protein [Treponema sp.]
MTPEAEDPRKKIMEIKNMDKSFGGVHAANSFSFNIYEGEILGLIGPNGCGKSTTVNLITGVYKHDSGEIIYYGKDGTRYILDKQSTPLRAKLGIARTFQTPKPFSDMTVFDNIFTVAMLYNRSMKEARKHTEEIIEFLGFTGIANEKSTKLPIEKRKWMDMARALAAKPRILMLDECLAGLTPSEIDESLEVVRKINRQGITILFIEHVMSAVVNLCQRVVVMLEGRYLTEGVPAEVMKEPEVIRAYLGEGYKL